MALDPYGNPEQTQQTRQFLTYAPGAVQSGLVTPPPGYVAPQGPSPFRDTPDGIWQTNGYTYAPRDATPRPGFTFNPSTGYWVSAPTAAPTPTPAPSGGTPAPRPPPGSIGEIALSPSPNYPTPAPMPSVPTFTPPSYTPPPAFKGPSVEEALNDPSYQFRKQQGEDSLQRWAAARGTLNDSGTAKALIDYGGGSASQEWANEWNRAYQTYQTNYQTQFADPNNIAFRDAAASFVPQMTGYSTTAAATQRQNELSQQLAFSAWQEDWNKYFGLAQLQSQ